MYILFTCTCTVVTGSGVEVLCPVMRTTGTFRVQPGHHGTGGKAIEYLYLSAGGRAGLTNHRPLGTNV